MNTRAAAPGWADTAPGHSSLPAGLYALHIIEQVLLVIATGIALSFASRGSWLGMMADQALPHILVPLAEITVPSGLALPFLAVVVTGIPAVVSRLRPAITSWLVLVILLATATIIESDRLNWVAFFSGVSVRLLEGPVPLRRTMLALVAMMMASLIITQESVHTHIAELRRRGVSRHDVRALRGRMMAFERGTALVVTSAGWFLLLIAHLSMAATERAPVEGAGAAWPVVAVAVIVLTMIALFGVALARGAVTGRASASQDQATGAISYHGPER